MDWASRRVATTPSARSTARCCESADCDRPEPKSRSPADISPSERLVTIEDSLELGLERYPDLHPDCIALEAREANLEGQGGISLAELVRWAREASYQLDFYRRTRQQPAPAQADDGKGGK